MLATKSCAALFDFPPLSSLRYEQDVPHGTLIITLSPELLTAEDDQVQSKECIAVNVDERPSVAADRHR